jgi:hypothetical protein
MTHRSYRRECGTASGKPFSGDQNVLTAAALELVYHAQPDFDVLVCSSLAKTRNYYGEGGQFESD